jgi:hypothetical protein
MKTIVALAITLMMPGFAAAQINKCLDKSGKVVGYGSECPAGTRSEASGVKSAPAASSSGAAAGASTPAPTQKSLAERDADFRKRQMEKQEGDTKAQKAGAESERRKQACDDSQSYLKSLQAGNRIVRTDPRTGERSYLTDTDYPAEIAKTQQSVQSYCK